MTRRRLTRVVAAAAALAVLGISAGTLKGAIGSAPARDGFPHRRHAGVFPLCTSCHAGAATPGAPMFPAAAACASCHDGQVERRVDWTPRIGARPGNLRFTHAAHDTAAVRRSGGDTALILDCTRCHSSPGAERMAVHAAVVTQCLSCHGFTAPHLALPDTACSTCHVRLTDATRLTAAQIERFPRPPSHDAPGFVLGGHGTLARGTAPSGPFAVAASCATCHARNECLTCHVNAPETRAIQALALDDRAPGHARSLPVPPSHAAAGFLESHGSLARGTGASCATCHAQESCTTCHVAAPPRAVARLPQAGDGRAVGAVVTRHAPPTHTIAFREGGHAAEASARPSTCETCHTRSMCLDCHRPANARQAGYHPPGFLTRHPGAAYAREASCSDCHNPAQFCQSCHQQSGLTAASRIGLRGYHDAFRGFSLGHGQAARQSLESCASCHAERDCTACHSAVNGGFGFSPHGPGFDAERMKRKNPTLCVACHGRAIPG